MKASLVIAAALCVGTVLFTAMVAVAEVAKLLVRMETTAAGRARRSRLKALSFRGTKRTPEGAL
jgi:hypothetical protein